MLPLRPLATPIELPYAFGQPTPIQVDQNTDDWLRVRTGCDLTASEIASALGVGYGSPAALWRKKTGKITDQRDEPNHYQVEAMKRGQFLEPFARERMDILLNRRAMNGGFWKRTVEYKGVGFTLGASPDGIYAQTVLEPEPAVLEIKCPNSKTECAPDSPDYKDRFWTYFFQIQCQLFCTGYKRAILFIFHPDLPNVAYRLKYDHDMWVSYVLPRLAEFIQAVRQDVCPGRVPKSVRKELQIVWAEKLADRGTIRDFPLPTLQSSPGRPKRTAADLRDGEVEDETLEAIAVDVELRQAKQRALPDRPDPPSPEARACEDTATR